MDNFHGDNSNSINVSGNTQPDTKNVFLDIGYPPKLNGYEQQQQQQQQNLQQAQDVNLNAQTFNDDLMIMSGYPENDGYQEVEPADNAQQQQQQQQQSHSEEFEAADAAKTPASESAAAAVVESELDYSSSNFSNFNRESDERRWNDHVTHAKNAELELLAQELRQLPETGLVIPPPSESSKKKAGSNPKHVKRPLNSFMLFSKIHRPAEKSKQPNPLHKTISVRLGVLWKALAPEQKKLYEIEAKRELIKHKLKYPDYKYKPKRKARYLDHAAEDYAQPGSRDYQRQEQKVSQPPLKRCYGETAAAGAGSHNQTPQDAYVSGYQLSDPYANQYGAGFFSGGGGSFQDASPLNQHQPAIGGDVSTPAAAMITNFENSGGYGNYSSSGSCWQNSSNSPAASAVSPYHSYQQQQQHQVPEVYNRHAYGHQGASGYYSSPYSNSAAAASTAEDSPRDFTSQPLTDDKTFADLKTSSGYAQAYALDATGYGQLHAGGGATGGAVNGYGQPFQGDSGNNAVYTTAGAAAAASTAAEGGHGDRGGAGYAGYNTDAWGGGQVSSETFACSTLEFSFQGVFSARLISRVETVICWPVLFSFFFCFTG